MRLMTEFELFALSKYLVETWLVGCEKDKSKASAMSTSKSLWTEWKEYEGFQLLSLILKSPVMTKTLWMFASVFFRYFEADWLASE